MTGKAHDHERRLHNQPGHSRDFILFARIVLRPDSGSAPLSSMENLANTLHVSLLTAEGQCPLARGRNFVRPMHDARLVTMTYQDLDGIGIGPSRRRRYSHNLLLASTRSQNATRLELGSHTRATALSRRHRFALLVSPTCFDFEPS